MRRTRITRVVAILVAIATASACASPDVGYQEDGHYVLEPRELAMDCNQLSKDQLSRLQTLKNLPWYAEWEKGNEPPTLALAWGRWFGADNKGLAHLDEYERARAYEGLARLDGDEGLSSRLRRRPGAGADRRGDRALQAIAVCLPALAD